MKKNLINIDWDKTGEYNEEEISYFLFLEGKSIEAISKIRNLNKEEIQKHIIEGKIKYRYLVKSSNIEEFFILLCEAGKEDRIALFEYIDRKTKKKLIKYIKENYADMLPKYKEKAVWTLGELKEEEGISVLIKASVHKFVSIRRLSISAMGKINSERCEIALIRALDDENPQVVLYAIKALKKLKSRKALDKIKYVKNNAKKDYIKIAADEYIKEII